MTFSWTTETTALAFKLYVTEGRSAEITAKLIGAPSRNSVIGVAHRRGWTALRSTEVRDINTARANRAGAAALRLARAKQAELRALKPPKQPKSKPPEPTMPKPRNLTLMELKPHTCRWPVTNAEPWLFCGLKCEGTYCERHRAISVQPAKPRMIKAPRENAARMRA